MLRVPFIHFHHPFRDMFPKPIPLLGGNLLRDFLHEEVRMERKIRDGGRGFQAPHTSKHILIFWAFRGTMANCVGKMCHRIYWPAGWCKSTTLWLTKMQGMQVPLCALTGYEPQGGLRLLLWWHHICQSGQTHLDRVEIGERPLKYLWDCGDPDDPLCALNPQKQRLSIWTGLQPKNLPIFHHASRGSHLQQIRLLF